MEGAVKGLVGAATSAGGEPATGDGTAFAALCGVNSVSIDEPLHIAAAPLQSVLVVVIGIELLHKGREDGVGEGRAISNAPGDVLHFVNGLAKGDGTRCGPSSVETAARAGGVLGIGKHPQRWPETLANGKLHASRDTDHLVASIP